MDLMELEMKFDVHFRTAENENRFNGSQFLSTFMNSSESSSLSINAKHLLTLFFQSFSLSFRFGYFTCMHNIRLFPSLSLSVSLIEKVKKLIFLSFLHYFTVLRMNRIIKSHQRKIFVSSKKKEEKYVFAMNDELESSLSGCVHASAVFL